MDLWGVVVPAIVLVGAWVAVRGWLDQSSDRWWPIIAAVLWLLYWFWETQVVQPDDNIRVDVLFLYPLLLVVTILAIRSLIGMARRRRIPPPPLGG